MDKKEILETLKILKEFSKKRNFNQGIDLIINLKELNLKKPEDNVDLYIILPYAPGRKVKICAFADKSLKDVNIFDKVISEGEFSLYSDKKKIKKLAKEHDFFVAQANLMGKVATTFGKYLGPRGKMPSPKAGCVFPPNADLKLVKERLDRTINLRTKNELVVKALVGKENMKEEEIAENVFFVYNSLIHALSKELHNIKNIYLKYTMGIPVKVGDKKEDVEKRMETEKPESIIKKKSEKILRAEEKK